MAAKREINPCGVTTYLTAEDFKAMKQVMAAIGISSQLEFIERAIKVAIKSNKEIALQKLKELEAFLKQSN